MSDPEPQKTIDPFQIPIVLKGEGVSLFALTFTDFNYKPELATTVTIKDKKNREWEGHVAAWYPYIKKGQCVQVYVNRKHDPNNASSESRGNDGLINVSITITIGQISYEREKILAIVE